MDLFHLDSAKIQTAANADGLTYRHVESPLRALGWTTTIKGPSPVLRCEWKLSAQACQTFVSSKKLDRLYAYMYPTSNECWVDKGSESRTPNERTAVPRLACRTRWRSQYVYERTGWRGN